MLVSEEEATFLVKRNEPRLPLEVMNPVSKSEQSVASARIEYSEFVVVDSKLFEYREKPHT